MSTILRPHPWRPDAMAEVPGTSAATYRCKRIFYDEYGQSYRGVDAN